MRMRHSKRTLLRAIERHAEAQVELSWNSSNHPDDRAAVIIRADRCEAHLKALLDKMYEWDAE